MSLLFWLLTAIVAMTVFLLEVIAALTAW